MKKFFYTLIAYALAGLLFFGAGEAYLRFFSVDTGHQKTVSAVGISIFQPSANDVWEHKPGATDLNGYGNPTPLISINSIGLRDAEFDTAMAQENNILMLGDSFTFGTGLSADETFPELLEGLIRSKAGSTWHVWNAGVIGTSADDHYMNLKKYDPLLEPKIAVVNVFAGNDITELRRHRWEKGASGDLERVIDEGVMVNEKNQLQDREKEKPVSLFWDFLKTRISILYYKFAAPPDQPTLTWPVFLPPGHAGYDDRLPQFWDRFFDALDLIQKFCEKNDIRLLVNIIPMDVQVSRSYWKKYTPLYFDDEAFTANRPQKKILEFCVDNKIGCLDLLPAFRDNKNKDRLYFLNNGDPHFDAAGHRLTSELLFNRLSVYFQNHE